MAKYIRAQYEVKCWIDEDGDLVITQYGMDNEDTILISIGNIQHFIDIIQMTVKEGYIGEDDGLV